MAEYYQDIFILCLGALGEPKVAEGLWSLFQLLTHKLEVSAASQRQAYSEEIDSAKREISQTLQEQHRQLIGHQTELGSFVEETRKQLNNEATIRSEHVKALDELRKRTFEFDQSQTALQAQVKAGTCMNLQSLEALTKQFQLSDEKVQQQSREEHRILDNLIANSTPTHQSLQAFEAQVQAEISLVKQTLEELEEHCRSIDSG